MTLSVNPAMPEVVSQSDNTMVLSMGPQHPSTHGVLQIVLEIDSENVVKADPEIGYLHTGIEKTAEGLFWTQAQTALERMDYLAPSSNALGYALAVEKLLGITDRIPPRAQVVRVLQMELTRIASHCVWLGTHGIDLGAISVFFYCFDLRENILDLQEATGGARMHPNYIRIGGLNGDLPKGYMERLDALIEKFPGRLRELRGLLQANPIFQDRTIDVGVLTPEEALQWSVTGPALARQRDRLRRSSRVSVLADTKHMSLIFRRASKPTLTRASWCASTRWKSRCASSSRRVNDSIRPVR